MRLHVSMGITEAQNLEDSLDGEFPQFYKALSTVVGELMMKKDADPACSVEACIELKVTA